MKNILHQFSEPFVCPSGKTVKDPEDIPCITCRYFLGTEQPSGELALEAEIVKCSGRKK